MNTAIKNLLLAEPKALKNLHRVSHIDWKQPASVTEYSGKFTHKSILKEISTIINGDDINNYNIFLLYKLNLDTFRWKSNYLYIAQVNSQKFLITRDEIKNYTKHSLSYYFDVEHCKGDFEKYRKDEGTHYWLIIQSKAMENYNAPNYDEADRYICNKDRGNTYFKPMYANYSESSNETYGKIPEELDKSGYKVQRVRAEYRRRLAEIRREKSAAAAKVYDNTEKLAEFKQRLTAIHSRITEILNQPQPDYKKISNATSKLWWRDSDIEEYKLNKFDSIEQVRSTENRIDSTLNEVAAILD